jgi:UTP--glucose-1-phosphate uridylyltransferase
MILTKAVIPVAGFGTRMLPAAKAVAKEMLPILDRPAIQYVVEEAAAAELADVLLVTSRYKRAIEDHFDRDAALESRLGDGEKRKLLASVDALAAKVKIHSVRQPEMRGLGDAVLQAAHFCGNEPFVVMLGDAIFSGGRPPAVQLRAAFAELNTPIIGLERVDQAKVDRYGIAAGPEIRPGLIRIDTLVEKPRPGAAPGNLAIAARYVLTPGVFDCLQRTAPGAGGEIQLTDALRLLLERQPVHGVVLESTRHDIGDLFDWLATNLRFAAADAKLRARLAPLLRELLASITI